MKFLNGVTSRIKLEKAGWLVGVAAVYGVTLVALLVWPSPTPVCRVVSPLDVLQCAVLSTHASILAIVALVMGGTLVATRQRSNWYEIRRYATVSAIVVYVVLMGGWVLAYSLL